jgi:hypothetical protein
VQQIDSAAVDQPNRRNDRLGVAKGAFGFMRLAPDDIGHADLIQQRQDRALRRQQDERLELHPVD